MSKIQIIRNYNTIVSGDYYTITYGGVIVAVYEGLVDLAHDIKKINLINKYDLGHMLKEREYDVTLKKAYTKARIIQWMSIDGDL